MGVYTDLGRFDEVSLSPMRSTNSLNICRVIPGAEAGLRWGQGVGGEAGATRSETTAHLREQLAQRMSVLCEARALWRGCQGCSHILLQCHFKNVFKLVIKNAVKMHIKIIDTLRCINLSCLIS